MPPLVNLYTEPDVFDLAAGIPITPSMAVPVGTAFTIQGTIYLHPLDVLYLTRPDPCEHLHEAMEWFTARAHRQLDALAAALLKGGDDQ